MLKINFDDEKLKTNEKKKDGTEEMTYTNQATDPFAKKRRKKKREIDFIYLSADEMGEKNRSVANNS